MSLPDSLTNGHAESPAIPSPRPAALTVNADGIPAELRKGKRFNLWRYDWVGSEDSKPGRWSKTPYQRNGRKASSTDPTTWCMFDEAMAAYCKGGWDGIGRNQLPEDILIGADGDHGTEATVAADAVRSLDTYTELSPSGRGLRAFAHAKKPGPRCKKDDFEIYDGLTKEGKAGGRYLTLTGHHVPGTPTTVNDRQAEVDAVYLKMFGPVNKPAAAGDHKREPLPSSDDDLVRRISQSGQGSKFDRLMAGDTSGYPSASEAHAALCCVVAFWTRDAGQIERIVSSSALAEHPKWKRPDYRERTIGGALELVTETHEPRRRVRVGTANDPARTICQTIHDWFVATYRPQYRSGNSIRSGEGRDVYMAEATAVLTSGLIAEMETAEDAPRFKGANGAAGAVNRNALPGAFKTWAKVAWGDMLQSLPDEDTAEAGNIESAREEFRQMVREAMLSECTLAQTTKAGPMKVESRIERDSLIGWCAKFAKPGPWRSIRGKRCWTKLVELDGGEVVLKVAIDHGLFGQMKADRRLVAMGQKRFSRRAKRYGVGASSRDERPHGQYAVVLDPEFLADLTTTPVNDDSDHADGAEEFGIVPNSQIHSESDAKNEGGSNSTQPADTPGPVETWQFGLRARAANRYACGRESLTNKLSSPDGPNEWDAPDPADLQATDAAVLAAIEGEA